MSRPCHCGRTGVGDYRPGVDCWDCWRWVNSAWWREWWETGIPTTAPPPTAPPPAALVTLARADGCEHLGRREEFRHGCGGLSCRHGCDLGLPAVPAGYCQTCEHYDALPGVPWLS